MANLKKEVRELVRGAERQGFREGDQEGRTAPQVGAVAGADYAAETLSVTFATEAESLEALGELYLGRACARPGWT